jgi:hypothetical protein
LQTITGVKGEVASLVVSTNTSAVKSEVIGGITITNMKSLPRDMQKLGQQLPPEIWEEREDCQSAQLSERKADGGACGSGR